MMEEEEEICRYCFDGRDAGELLSPCNCKGGQKWVHLECLRRWQRMVLVSSPTHPAFQRDDLRSMVCSVCKSKFSNEPPSRHELMTSFTGPELAALVDHGCIIGAGIEFSRELGRARILRISEGLPADSNDDHWRESAYLITKVEEDDGLFSISFDTNQELGRFRDAINQSSEGEDVLILSLGEKRLKLTRGGDLSSVEGDDHLSLYRAFQALSIDENGLNHGVEIVLEQVDEHNEKIPRDCGDDHVIAVNLCRPQSMDFAREFPAARLALEKAISQIAEERGALWAQRARAVEIVHHLGGPCDPTTITRCLVPGISPRGYTFVHTLEEALLLSARLAHAVPSSLQRATPVTPDSGPSQAYAHIQDRIAPGQRVVLDGLAKNSELNGQAAIVLKAVEADSRWLVRLETDSNGAPRLVAVRPAHLYPDDNPTMFYTNILSRCPPDPTSFNGRIFVYWGDARWSRTQLLGEIARGHWGLCRSTLAEILASPISRRKTLDGRLVFAPITAMTEASIANARSQMAPLRQQAVLAAAALNPNQEDDSGIPAAIDSPRPSSSVPMTDDED